MLAVSSRDIESAEELREAVAKVREGGVVALLVMRGRDQIFIPVRIGKPES